MVDERGRQVAGVIAVIALGTIAVQLGINFGKASGLGTPAWMVPINLYGYFTIWSNTLVGLVAGSVALGRTGILTRPGTLAATVVYILVVGAIYNVLLIDLNPVQGVGWVTDRLLHMVVPVLYPLWWLLWVKRGLLGWHNLLPALVLPTVYSFVAMGKGAATGKYPYFFLDVGKYGLENVLLNIGGLVLLFAGLMAVVIGFDRRAARGTVAGPAA